MSHIAEIAQQLEHIYAQDGPAIGAWSSLKDAAQAMADTRALLVEVGAGSQGSELFDSIVACQKAVEAAAEAQVLVASAAGRIATVRSRVVGEIYDDHSAHSTGGKRPQDTILSYLHKDERGRIQKGHPDPAAEGAAMEYMRGMVDEAIRFQAFVDSAPNLNESYAADISIAQQYFESRGMPISPVVILGPEEFAEACRLSGEPRDPDAIGGFFSNDRTIVKQQTGEMATYNISLGVLIHESGHSTGGYNPRIVLETHDGQNGNLRASIATPRGFRKYNSAAPDLKVHDTGGYFEEGFSDLNRVDALTELGREPRFDGAMRAEMGCTYVGEGQETPLPDLTSQELIIPARFAMGAKTPDSEGKGGGIITAPAGIAAYGLELMDKAAPGLRETMIASRRDPKQQAQVIRLIESIRPGLYKELRQLPTTFEGATKGLRIVGQAIRDRR